MKNMSKKTVIISGFVLVLIVAVFCIIRYNNTRINLVTVSQEAFFSGKPIYVNVHMTHYLPMWNGVQFMAKESLEEIGEEIRFSYPDAMVENRERSLFISIPDSDAEKHDYYYLYACEDGRYLFGNFMAAHGNPGSYFDFIIPMHLLCYDDYEPFDNLGYGYGERFEMVSGATIEDIYNFYRDSGYYEAEWNGDQVKLINTLCENRIEADRVIKNYRIEESVIINVNSKDGRNYFTFTIEEGDEIFGNR